ncbi:Protein of unknown function [Gryllus bimaculatus]|nr:Protein of unknown function [Gryllus bimaculatus]
MEKFEHVETMSRPHITQSSEKNKYEAILFRCGRRGETSKKMKRNQEELKKHEYDGVSAPMSTSERGCRAGRKSSVQRRTCEFRRSLEVPPPEPLLQMEYTAKAQLRSALVSVATVCAEGSKPAHRGRCHEKRSSSSGGVKGWPESLGEKPVAPSDSMRAPGSSAAVGGGGGGANCGPRGAAASGRQNKSCGDMW